MGVGERGPLRGGGVGGRGGVSSLLNFSLQPTLKACLEKCTLCCVSMPCCTERQADR